MKNIVGGKVTPNKIQMKNIESNNVKGVSTHIYGCPEIRSKYTELGQSTLKTTQYKFQPLL